MCIGKDADLQRDNDPAPLINEDSQNYTTNLLPGRREPAGRPALELMKLSDPVPTIICPRPGHYFRCLLGGRSRRKVMANVQVASA